MEALKCGCRQGKGLQSSSMMYFAISVLFVTKFVFSWNMDCTRITAACPTSAQWSERGNSFNCSGNKKYVCLMAPKAELREGCIFDSIIPPGRVGCPYTKQCDFRTGQPLLVTQNNYLPCPPDLNGCPPHNHPGYSIREIYKYPRCQGKNISEESLLSNDTMTTIQPARIHEDINWEIGILCIMLGLILVSAITFIIIFRGKIKGLLENCRDHQHSGNAANGKYNSDSYYSNDGRSSIHTSEGNSKDMVTHSVTRIENTDLTTSVVNSVNENDVSLEYKRDNTGKERLNLQPTIRQQFYQITQETSKMSSSNATIKAEVHDYLSECIDMKDSDAAAIVNHQFPDRNSDFVNPISAKSSKYIAGTEKIDHTFTETTTSGPTKKEPFSILRSVQRQLSIIKRERLQISTPGMTTEKENQNFIEENSETGKKESQSRSCSWSSTDSDRSYTPILKGTCELTRQQSNSRLRISPSEGNKRTEVFESNSLRNKFPERENIGKTLRKIKSLKEGREMADKSSIRKTSKYVKELEKALEQYHQENKDLKALLKMKPM